MKKNRYVFSFLAATLICCLTISGCSFSDIVDSAGKALGLSMNSDSSEDSKVEIEYYEYNSDKVKESDAKLPNTIEENPEVTIEETDTTDDTVEEQYVEIYDDVNKTYSKEAASPDKVTISFAGDIILAEGTSVLSSVRRHDNDMQNCFGESLLSLMQSSDIFLVNNEFPYSSGGSPTVGKTYTFRASPEDAPQVKAIGADLVSIANNHSYDYGPTALLDTLATLKYYKLPYIGAGENIDEASKPAYFIVNGKTIAFIAATQIEGFANPDTKEATETSPGVLRCLDTTRIKSIIAEAKTKSDFVICFIHWGQESTDVITDWQKRGAADMAEAGADLIIGGHSHCLQGIDYVNGVPVCYSLGNYLFNSKTLDTCLITATLDTSSDDVSLSSLQFIPCIQSGGTTSLADESNAERILKYEQSISFHAKLDDQGYISYSETNMNTQNGRNTSPAKKEATPSPEANTDDNSDNNKSADE